MSLTEGKDLANKNTPKPYMEIIYLGKGNDGKKTGLKMEFDSPFEAAACFEAVNSFRVDHKIATFLLTSMSIAARSKTPCRLMIKDTQQLQARRQRVRNSMTISTLNIGHFVLMLPSNIKQSNKKENK